MTTSRSVWADDTGHLYQGRFKSLPVQEDEHFLTVGRYVERNAFRANLCSRAEDWPWSSLHHRHRKEESAQAIPSPWPVLCPRLWLSHIQQPQTDAERVALRRSVTRGSPSAAPSGWNEPQAS